MRYDNIIIMSHSIYLHIIILYLIYYLLKYSYKLKALKTITFTRFIIYCLTKNK